MKMIQNDKASHFLHGLIISFTVGWVYPILGFLAATAVGYGKEAWDRRGNGTFDPADFYWTSGGGILGAAIQAALVPLFYG